MQASQWLSSEVSSRSIQAGVCVMGSSSFEEGGQFPKSLLDMVDMVVLVLKSKAVVVVVQAGKGGFFEMLHGGWGGAQEVSVQSAKPGHEGSGRRHQCPQ